MISTTEEVTRVTEVELKAFQEGPLLPERTVTGEFLAELGKGLPSHKKGVTCQACKHKGYIREWVIDPKAKLTWKIGQPLPWRECIFRCHGCKGFGECFSH